MSPLDEPSASSHSRLPATSNAQAADAVAAAAPLTRCQRARFIFRAIEVRLRFIARFVGIGLLMAYWTTLEAYWGIAVGAAGNGSPYRNPLPQAH